MAVKTVEIKTYVDDLDGTEHEDPLGTYKVIDPDSGQAWALDLSDKSFDKLVKALAPFLASETKVRATGGGNAPTTKTTKPKKWTLTSDPHYDTDAFKVWAEGQGIKTGKRPKNDHVNAFLDSVGCRHDRTAPS